MNENELIKQINNLEDKINPNKLVCRNLRASDWNTLQLWWKNWPEWAATSPTKDILPENGTSGLMIQKNGLPIVAGFIYETNSKCALLEWIVSSPQYRDKDRNQAVELLITEAEQYCKKMGYDYVFSIGRDSNLIKKHKKLGWFVDPGNSREIIKKI